MKKRISLRSSPSLAMDNALSKLTPEQLERLAVAVICAQRRRVDHAQRLYDRLDSIQKSASTKDGEGDTLYHYTNAVLSMKAHHQIAAAVIDRLGYIPQGINSGER
ncbi:transcriptional repressor TraM [Notoacmeibacter ruber]|nr:transcriptional repressor TraM [Notoacmeibacter ruber]